MKFQINHDVYNISNRVKDIERGYYLIFNTSNQKFEIHSSTQIGSSYCLTLPFEKLDERTLTYVRSTMSKNIDEILNKIENENNILENANQNSVFSSVMENLEQELEK